MFLRILSEMAISDNHGSLLVVVAAVVQLRSRWRALCERFDRARLLHWIAAVAVAAV